MDKNLSAMSSCSSSGALRKAVTSSTSVALDDEVVDYMAAMIDEDPLNRETEPLKEIISAFVTDEAAVSDLAQQLQVLWENKDGASPPPPPPTEVSDPEATSKPEETVPEIAVVKRDKPLTSAERRQMRKDRSARQKAKTGAKAEEENKKLGIRKSTVKTSDTKRDTGTKSEAMVELKGIILAFPGCILLKQSDLIFHRGHRYALLGNNGTGKTTLLHRIGQKDIHGFPDISVYFVTHEIDPRQASVSPVEWMAMGDSTSLSGARGSKGKSQNELLGLLREVGFTDDLLAKAVTELSGGWRMRLAIARSMLHSPDLLLLDEPTNHLDRAAVEWLTAHLQNFKATICVVSHDYEFLSKVATDIVHLSGSLAISIW